MTETLVQNRGGTSSIFQTAIQTAIQNFINGILTSLGLPTINGRALSPKNRQFTFGNGGLLGNLGGSNGGLLGNLGGSTGGGLLGGLSGGGGDYEAYYVIMMVVFMMPNLKMLEVCSEV